MSDKASQVSLSLKSCEPLSVQIQNTILEKIKSGEWAKGTKTPSENALAEELSISRMTINRALRELTQKGYLERVHGLGTFVVQPPRHTSLIEIDDISEVIKTEGRNHKADIWHLQSEFATTEVAKLMEVQSGTLLFHLIMVHFQDGIPIQLEDRWVNPSIVPDFLNANFNQHSPTQYLINHITPDEMEHIVRAKLPNNDMQEMLAISSTEPCLCLSRRTWKENSVVTYANFTYPSSRYELGSRYPTKP